MKQWLKDHPKILVAIGGVIVAVVSSFGIAPEPVQSVLRALASLLGLL